MLGSRRRLVFLVVGMAVVGFGVVLVTFLVLYGAAFEGLRAQLAKTARSRARLVESVADFNRQYSPGFPGGPGAATLEQITAAHERFDGYGGTGEFTLGRLEGESIVYLLTQGHSGRATPISVPVESELAEPMRRALRGESGTVIGLDYQGDMVLAAYEPVVGMGLGVVAKIDLSEIRAPFIRAGSLALIAGIVLIGIGAFLFRAIMEPLMGEVWISEQKFRSLFERSIDAIAIVNTDGVLEDANDALGELLGYERRELLGTNVGTLYANPERREEFIEAVGASGSVREFDAKLQRKDGTEIDCLFTAAARMGANGGTSGHVTFIRDVTEPKRAEDMLQYQATMLASMADAVITTDPDLVITSWNLGAERMYGWRADEVVGKTMAEVGDIDYLKTTREEVVAILRNDGFWSGEAVHTNRDGRSISVMTVATLVKDEGGEPIGVVAVHRDISERVRMELELRAERNRAQQYLDVASVMLVVLDAVGRVTLINRKGLEILGYASQEDLLGANWFDTCLPAEHAADAKVVFDRLIAGDPERAADHCNPVVTRSGERRMITWRNALLTDEHGTPMGVLSSGEDVTEQRKLEGQLRQAQKMEAIGQLTGGIAHDFNNELLVILLNAQMLSDRIEQGEAPRMDELGDIAAAANRATEMTRQLVGFSRRAALKPKPTDLARRVKKLSKMLARILPANIRVQTEADQSVESVLVDPNSVEQMLLNLVTNARYAMPDGGELNVRVWESDLDEEYCLKHAPITPGRYVLVSVTDTGVGMDAATKAQIFEPFFTTRPVGEGTGLGMSMVYGLTKQQRGFVHVDSEEGHGTTVKLAFPVVAGPASATAEHEVVTGATGGTETILFVDDEQPLRRVGRRVLEAQGYRVVTACDGEDALANLRSNPREFDLVISDLMMPNMNGVELCSAMESERITVPIIITSGYSDQDVQAELNTKTEVPIVRKPWTVAEMLTVVRATLERS